MGRGKEWRGFWPLAAGSGWWCGGVSVAAAAVVVGISRPFSLPSLECILSPWFSSWFVCFSPLARSFNLLQVLFPSLPPAPVSSLSSLTPPFSPQS